MMLIRRLAAVCFVLAALAVTAAHGFNANRLGQIAMDGLRKGRLAPLFKAPSAARNVVDRTQELREAQDRHDGGGGEDGAPGRRRRLHDLTAEDERRGRHDAVVHHSLHPPFAGVALHDDRAPFWEFGAGTVMSDSYVRLTPRESGRHGYLWNTQRNAIRSWEAHIGLAVHSATPLGADGMAFWYRDSPSKLEGSSAAGPMLGARDDGFRGLGVMLDSYDNNNGRDGPRVAVVYRPWQEGAPLSKREFAASEDFAPSLDDDSASDPNPPDAYGCSYNFRAFTGDSALTVLKVRYDAIEKRLTVSIRNAASESEVDCADLKEIDLPTGFYFGFTAETGGLADHHDVAFFHLTPLSPRSEEERARRELEEMDAHEQAMAAHGTTPWLHHGGFDHRADQLEQIKHRAAAPEEAHAWAESMRRGNEVKKQMPHGEQQAAARDDVARKRAALEAQLAAKPSSPKGVAEEMANAGAERHASGVEDAERKSSAPDHLRNVPRPDGHVENAEYASYKRTGSAAGHSHDAHHHHGGDGSEPVPDGEKRFFSTLNAKLEAKKAENARVAAEQDGEAANEEDDGSAASAVPEDPSSGGTDDGAPPPGASGAKQGWEAHGDADVIRARVRGRNGRVGRRGR